MKEKKLRLKKFSSNSFAPEIAIWLCNTFFLFCHWVRVIFSNFFSYFSTTITLFLSKFFLDFRLENFRNFSFFSHLFYDTFLRRERGRKIEREELNTLPLVQFFHSSLECIMILSKPWTFCIHQKVLMTIVIESILKWEEFSKRKNFQKVENRSWPVTKEDGELMMLMTFHSPRDWFCNLIWRHVNHAMITYSNPVAEI